MASSTKKQTPTGGFIQRDTPPVSEGPRHFGLNMFAPDGTRLTDGDGNWVANPQSGASLPP